MYCPQVMHPQTMQKVFAQHYYSSTAHSRNRRATSTGNSIRCSVPGLKSDIEIPFPDRKLPVCKRCKKIYKTRELCRVRDRHMEVPWSTTYICVTLDGSCFIRNSGGELKLADEDSTRFVARSIPGPPAAYRSRNNALGGTKSPICMACKDKNYTRHHCRVKNKHMELPWGTVYVMLSAVPSGPGGGSSGFYNDNDSVSESAGSKRSASASESVDGSEPSSKKSKSTVTKEENESNDEDEEEAPKKESTTEDISQVQPSKAFLLTVGKDDCVLNWLAVDPSAAPHSSESSPSWGNEPPMDNMYQPPFYNNGPPPGWSGYSNNFMPNGPGSQNQHHPAMNGGGNPMSSMNGGRNTPHDYNTNGPHRGYPSSSYGNDHNNYSNQMGKPPMPPQSSMSFNSHNNSYPSYEDRENQGPVMNHQGGPPGPPMNMGYPPNKPFQPHGPQNDGGASGPGGMMSRSSPVPPPGDYMGGNQNAPLSQAPYSQPQHQQQSQQSQHQQRGPPDQGFNPQNDYNRRDRFSGPPAGPPHGNGGSGSGGPSGPGPHGNRGYNMGGSGSGMPFYSSHPSNGPQFRN